MDQIPADTSNEPVTGQVTLMGMMVYLRRFASLVPIAATTRDLEEMPCWPARASA